MSRIQAIDWTRGLVMILMALDHASLYWNHGRIQDEGLQGLYPTFTSTAQFLTRFITHPCAPAFIFITGMMMSLSHSSTPTHFIKRGLLLIAADFLLINRVGLAFGVLACIGSSMILLSPAKFLPRHLILSASILILILHPLLDFPKTHSYLLHILAEPTRKGLAPVLYPIIPWIGVMGLGYWFGRPLQKSVREGKPSRFGRRCLFLGLALMIFFIPVRWGSKFEDSHDRTKCPVISAKRPLVGRAGMVPSKARRAKPTAERVDLAVLRKGNIYYRGRPFICHQQQASLAGAHERADEQRLQDKDITDPPRRLLYFWLMAKYPPSLPFLLWTLGITLILMGGFFLWEAKMRKINLLLKILATYGRVPLFFYIVHRYLYGLIPNLTHTRGQYSLGATCAVWLAGLVSLYFLCKWYDRRNYMITRGHAG